MTDVGFQSHEGSIQTNASHFCKIMVTQFQFQDSSIQTPFSAQNSAKFFVFQSNEGAIQINGPHFCKIILTQFQSHDGSIQTPIRPAFAAVATVAISSSSGRRFQRGGHGGRNGQVVIKSPCLRRLSHNSTLAAPPLCAAMADSTESTQISKRIFLDILKDSFSHHSWRRNTPATGDRTRQKRLVVGPCRRKMYKNRKNVFSRQVECLKATLRTTA